MNTIQLFRCAPGGQKVLLHEGASSANANIALWAFARENAALMPGSHFSQSRFVERGQEDVYLHIPTGVDDTYYAVALS